MTRTATPVAPPRTSACLGAVLLALLAPAATRGANGPVDGLVVTIPSPITTESTNRLRAQLRGPLKPFEAGRGRDGGTFYLLCDFNPDGKPTGSDNFGACLELARYLRSLADKGVYTVAYIRGPVRRHSVLAAAVCSEIVFSDKGSLGPVLDGAALEPDELAAYEQRTKGRRHAALIRALAAPGPGGATAYDFEQAVKAKLVKIDKPIRSVEELCRAFDVPHGGAARGLPRSPDRVVCWHLPVEGPVTGELVELTRRRVQRAVRARVDLIVLELRCGGGDLERAAELGGFLASLNDEPRDSPVETIAFVTTQAGPLATFLAFGCHRIVMQAPTKGEQGGKDEPETEARLGGFGPLLLDGRTPEQTRALEDTYKDALVALARKQRHPTLLAEGMFTRELRIWAVKKKDSGRRDLLTEAQLRDDGAKQRQWEQDFLVKPWKGAQGQDYLTLNAEQAQQVDLSQGTARDLADLYEQEGLTAGQVRTAEADWLDGLADFLRNPWTTFVLVMLGITCLMLELKMPGVGLPGVISAVCFVLFFWSHSQLNGQITWLAVLLFVLGLILLGVELFVLPGFGVCGFSGVLLVLTSLGLVAYGHWPRSGGEWVRFGEKLSPFGVSMLGAVISVVVIVRLLPHIPILNRLLPKQPEEGDEAAEAEFPGHAELKALLGAIGIAVTPLRPAGKSQFADSFVDVVAEGGYIMPGTRVQVVEVEGNRVVVKEV